MCSLQFDRTLVAEFTYCQLCRRVVTGLESQNSLIDSSVEGLSQ